MKKTTALILCCTLIFVSGDKENVSAPSKSLTTSKPTTIAPDVTTPPSTTSAAITTTSEATTTTTITTTTAKPITTTTTTENPKTTTITPATTTNAPTPAKDPESQKWIANGTNLIIVQWAVQLVVTYNDTNQQKLSVAINIPADKNKTHIDGTFAPYDESMTLAWNSTKNGTNLVSVHFKQDNATKTYILSSLEASIAADELPNSGLSSPLKLVHAQEHFNTSLDNSYRCVRLQNFNLTKDNDKSVVGLLKVSDLRFQAFIADTKKTSFGLAEDCAFNTPDAVPIAVGCILAALVVVVLVAYLISRRRSQARGYLSM